MMSMIHKYSTTLQILRKIKLHIQHNSLHTICNQLISIVFQRVFIIENEPSQCTIHVTFVVLILHVVSDIFILLVWERSSFTGNECISKFCI